MRIKRISIVALLGLFAIFGLRMFFVKQDQERREERDQMFLELSREQMKNTVSSDTLVRDLTREVMGDLDAQKEKLDSMRLDLEEKQKKFQEQMKKLQNNN